MQANVAPNPILRFIGQLILNIMNNGQTVGNSQTAPKTKAVKPQKKATPQESNKVEFDLAGDYSNSLAVMYSESTEQYQSDLCYRVHFNSEHANVIQHDLEMEQKYGPKQSS